jgi:hypothetical protein
LAHPLTFTPSLPVSFSASPVLARAFDSLMEHFRNWKVHGDYGKDCDDEPNDNNQSLCASRVEEGLRRHHSPHLPSNIIAYDDVSPY